MMKTYQAGKDPVEAWSGDTRGWVFDLLDNTAYRKRLETLAALDLTRRAGCEPCLRALVVDEWSYESLYHLSWCDSCRQASFALGMDGSGKAVAAASPWRRRALWLGVAAAAVVAVPVLGGRLLHDDNGQVARGGDAQQVGTGLPGTGSGGSTDPGGTKSGGTTNSGGATTTGGTTNSGGTTTTGGTTSTVPQGDPVPRSKPTGSDTHGSTGGSGHSGLPETT